MDVFNGSFMGVSFLYIWITFGAAVLIILGLFIWTWKKRRKEQEKKQEEKAKKKKKKDEKPEIEEQEPAPAIPVCDQCGLMDIVKGPCPECDQDTTACLDCSARLAPCACDEEVVVEEDQDQRPEIEDNPNVLKCECGNKKWMKIQCPICHEDTIVGCSECGKPLKTCVCNEKQEDIQDKPQEEVPQQRPPQKSKHNQQLEQQIANQKKIIRTMAKALDFSKMQKEDWNALKKALKITLHEGVDLLDPCNEVSEVLENCLTGKRAEINFPRDNVSISYNKWDKETEKGQKREAKAEQKTILMDRNPIKCECGSERVARIQCTQCGQGTVECLECERRLWSCGCDESKNDVDHPKVSAPEDVATGARATKPTTQDIMEAL